MGAHTYNTGQWRNFLRVNAQMHTLDKQKTTPAPNPLVGICMRTSIKISAIILTAFLYSCNGVYPGAEDETSVKLTLVKDFRIKILSPDTVEQDSLLQTFIHVDNPKYKIKQAHYSCTMTDPPSVDITTSRISGCVGPTFIIQNDTVRISGLVATKPGVVNFPEIIILAVDKDNNYFYDKCSFKYFVR